MPLADVGIGIVFILIVVVALPIGGLAYHFNVLGSFQGVAHSMAKQWVVVNNQYAQFFHSV